MCAQLFSVHVLSNAFDYEKKTHNKSHEFALQFGRMSLEFFRVPEIFQCTQHGIASLVIQKKISYFLPLPCNSSIHCCVIPQKSALVFHPLCALDGTSTQRCQEEEGNCFCARVRCSLIDLSRERKVDSLEQKNHIHRIKKHTQNTRTNYFQCARDLCRVASSVVFS